MIRNLCSRIPLTSPSTITNISNDYHRNIDVSLGFFTRFGFDSVSIRLIRKISIKYNIVWFITNNVIISNNFLGTYSTLYRTYGPRQANLVLIAYASSEGSGEPAQSRQNLRNSLIQAVSQEEPSDTKPDPWPRWMAGHAQLKFVMTECSKTRIRLMGLTFKLSLFYRFDRTENFPT